MDDVTQARLGIILSDIIGGTVLWDGSEYSYWDGKKKISMSATELINAAYDKWSERQRNAKKQ